VAASQLRGNLASFQTRDPQLDNPALIARQARDGLQERTSVERSQDLLFRRGPGIRHAFDVV